MAAKTSQSSKGLWWGAVAILCLLVIGVAYFGTRLTESHDIHQPRAAGGTAFSTTTDTTVPAVATPGGMNTGKTATGSATTP
jgi:hypothetical protein